MRISKTKLCNMPDYYLMGLLTNGNYRTDLESVKREFSNRLVCMPDFTLLGMWWRSKKGIIREILEDHLAIRYQNYQGPYDDLPVLATKYFERVTSVDAIGILTYSKCDLIHEMAMNRYHAVMEEYLTYYDELYKTEGSDLGLCSNKVIPFSKNKVSSCHTVDEIPAKIYKISDFKSRRR